MNRADLSYKKALFIVLGIHAVMFIVSFVSAILSGSTAVFADSLDFIGDALSYGISIYILNKAIIFRTCVAILKGLTMFTFAIVVMVYSSVRLMEGTPPDYEIMSIAAICGVIAHLVCAYVLVKHKDGDSNRLSVWICTVNDLSSNAITLIAAQIVMFTGSIIPDIIAAAVIVIIAIYGAYIILKQAVKELKECRECGSKKLCFQNQATQTEE